MTRVLVFALAFLGFCGNSAATKYTIGVQELAYFPHYDFTDQESNSLFEQLLKAFSDDTGIQFEIVRLPIKRLDNAFYNQKNIDFMFPSNPQWQDEVDVTYSLPLVNIIGGTMVRPEKKGSGLANFQSLTVPFGFKPVEWIKLSDEIHINFIELQDAQKCLNLVLSGRADGADIEFSVANYLVQEMGLPNALVIDTDLPTSQVGFHLATWKHKKVIKHLNQWLTDNASRVKQLKQDLAIVEHVSELPSYYAAISGAQ